MKSFSAGICLLLVLCGCPLRIRSQEATPVFVFPDARVGESYKISLESILRDRYRLRLQAGSPNAILQWTLAEGELPSGIALSSDGTIVGTPGEPRPQSYRFRLKVIDVALPDEMLHLDCALNVKVAALRLVKINGPMLVPLGRDDSPAKPLAVNPGSIENGNLTAIRVDEKALSAGSASSPQESAETLRWKEPDKRNGGSLENLTQSPLPLAVFVEPTSQACLLDILVMRTSASGLDNRLVDQQRRKVDLNENPQRFGVNVASGNNRVIVTAYKKKKDKDKCEPDMDLDSLNLVGSELTLRAHCEGVNCKFLKAALTGPNMRAILGIEQSGASSAASAQNPFVDFFFNSQLTKNRLLAWGDIRLTTTPQQVAAFASSATNAVGAATADKINDLATSFDFKIGPEFQLNPESNTRLSLIAGFGAISTLTGPPKGSPIFKLPVNTSTQYANFVNQYPEALTPGATHIAFVPQEQDRFYRQYFAGFRVRSYHEGQFPSMFDVTFGQNSAVTGGKLRHFVLGFEGSHRIPLMNNSIYIFGSANLKVGGPKFRSTPFVLDPADATVKLSDPTVVITSRQSNRDVYRLGFGIDLIKLFEPKKKE